LTKLYQNLSSSSWTLRFHSG